VNRRGPGLTAVFITGSAVALNALIGAHGSIITMTTWRGFAGVSGMIIMAVAAVVMIARARPVPPPRFQMLAVAVLCAVWASMRFNLHSPAVEDLIGTPPANTPLELALIVFTASRLWRWPEPFVTSLAVISYASHALLPEATAPSIRDMPVTFSFVLFSCLVASWWIQTWSRDERSANSRRLADGTDGRLSATKEPK
jgi:NhaP-type Na+/H+ or K+/H+ antiporter